jgi:hypothetical protein
MKKILILVCAAALTGCPHSGRDPKISHNTPQLGFFYHDMDTGGSVTFSDGRCFIERGLRDEELETLKRLSTPDDQKRYRHFCHDIGGIIIPSAHYDFLNAHSGIAVT